MTLILGVLLLAAWETLLAVDVLRRGGIVIPTDQPLPAIQTSLDYAARWVAVNMTALCWIAYLLVFEGLLHALPAWTGHLSDRSRRGTTPSASPIRARPNRFLVAWLTSIPVWCLFDWINFYFMDAWRYHGLPPQFTARLVGYFIAFAAISPGMFLAAQLYQHLGLRRLITRSPSRTRRIAWVLTWIVPTVLVALAILLAIRQRDATILNLVLWIGIIYLFDPINRRLGAPSLLADWHAGRWGRTLALFAGGATCGFCWEFWNYWALAKWTYHLPFLGSLEQYRYFEMPWLGFLGFLPFAAECWVLLNTFVVLMEKLGLRIAEPLPDEWTVM